MDTQQRSDDEFSQKRTRKTKEDADRPPRDRLPLPTKHPPSIKQQQLHHAAAPPPHQRHAHHAASVAAKKAGGAYAMTAEDEAIILVAWVPSRKSFLKRRAMWRTWRRRPVPVVRLRLLLALQLKVRLRGCGYAHDEQFFFWMWYDRRPQRTHSVCDLLVRFPNDDVPFVIAGGGWWGWRAASVVVLAAADPSTAVLVLTGVGQKSPSIS